MTNTAAHTSPPFVRSLTLCFFRELDHPNLCKFIGGCVEVPNVAIVTEYCPKGSLSDVLLNEEIPLNWGFRCVCVCVRQSVVNLTP